jgi:hypothetical protein
MSMVRLSLRHNLVNGLSGLGTAPPTIAGLSVFDSKIDQPVHDATETMLPAIIVYTDRDVGMNLDRNTGRTYSERHISVVIECIIGSFMKVQVEGKPEPVQVYRAVETDAEMEAMLDLFEWQVASAIYNPQYAPLRGFNAMVKRIEEWTSEPARSADQASRLSLRQITFTAVTNNDCRPGLAVLGQGERLPRPSANVVYFDAPYLAGLQQMIDEFPSMETLRDQLRSLRTGVPLQVVGKFQTMRMKIDNIDPADPNRVADGVGPDGRIEVDAEVKMED